MKIMRDADRALTLNDSSTNGISFRNQNLEVMEFEI
jgi:hypothetical protein